MATDNNDVAQQQLAHITTIGMYLSTPLRSLGLNADTSLFFPLYSSALKSVMQCNGLYMYDIVIVCAV